MTELDTSIVLRSFFYVIGVAYEWERWGVKWALFVGALAFIDLEIRKRKNRKAREKEEKRYRDEMLARYSEADL